MGKNKNLTEEEREIHRKATSLRKLTDKQLVERLDAVKSVQAIAETTEPRNSEPEIINRTAEFLDAVEKAEIFGIGKVTLKKLNDFARENKYI